MPFVGHDYGTCYQPFPVSCLPPAADSFAMRLTSHASGIVVTHVNSLCSHLSFPSLFFNPEYVSLILPVIHHRSIFIGPGPMVFSPFDSRIIRLS